MKNRIVLFLSIIAVLVGCKPSKKQQDFEKAESFKKIGDFSKLLQPVDGKSVLAEDGYFIWGGSVVKGDDNLYHMFYSRWKKEYGFNAWVTHSEIAHAVASAPEGPFQFKDIALFERGKEYWDGMTTHNPTVHKINNKYYLYYMGTTGDRKTPSSDLNFIHRNNQRIGVAWADDPNGPWNRFDQPLIDVSEDERAYDALMVSNPSVTQMEDGKVLMIYKAVAKHHELPFGGPVTHLAAIGDGPTGSFKKFPDPIFYKNGKKFPAEDPFIWYQPSIKQYYAIVKDMQGVFTNSGVSLAFFESENGLDWQPSANPLVSVTEIRWDNGKIDDVERLERPQVLLEDEIPRMLYCAVIQGDNTINVHIPLEDYRKIKGF